MTNLTQVEIEQYEKAKHLLPSSPPKSNERFVKDCNLDDNHRKFLSKSPLFTRGNQTEHQNEILAKSGNTLAKNIIRKHDRSKCLSQKSMAWNREEMKITSDLDLPERGISSVKVSPLQQVVDGTKKTFNFKKLEANLHGKDQKDAKRDNKKDLMKFAKRIQLRKKFDAGENNQQDSEILRDQEIQKTNKLNYKLKVRRYSLQEFSDSEDEKNMSVSALKMSGNKRKVRDIRYKTNSVMGVTGTGNFSFNELENENSDKNALKKDFLKFSNKLSQKIKVKLIPFNNVIAEAKECDEFTPKVNLTSIKKYFFF